MQIRIGSIKARSEKRGRLVTGYLSLTVQTRDDCASRGSSFVKYGFFSRFRSRRIRSCIHHHCGQFAAVCVFPCRTFSCSFGKSGLHFDFFFSLFVQIETRQRYLAECGVSTKWKQVCRGIEGPEASRSRRLKKQLRLLSHHNLIGKKLGEPTFPCPVNSRAGR